jgi:hypothetical protein
VSDPHLWSVAATVRARSEYVTDFIAHYAALGAKEIHLYFDDPQMCDYDPQVAAPVVAHVCNDRYWRATNGGRPDHMNQRQLANFAHALAHTPSAWLLNVDIDERLHATERIGDLLGRQSNALFSLCVPPLEAVYETPPSVATAFRTEWFKTPIREGQSAHNADCELLKHLHGELAALTRRGLFGHFAGKYFIRTHYEPETLDIHYATAKDRSLVARRAIPGFELLHFDALTFEDWKEKWLRRMTGEVICKMHDLRRRQLELISAALAADDDATLRSIYAGMYVVDSALLAEAVATGLIVRRRPTPAVLRS